jgi:hypothetical protein
MCIGACASLVCVQAFAQQLPDDSLTVPELTAGPLDLLIGPIDGLTTGWHPAPASTWIPAKATVQFKQTAEPQDQVVWTGAVETSRDITGSVAVLPAGISGRHVIRVQVIRSSGFIHERSCTIHATDVAAGEIRVRRIRVEADEVQLDETSGNHETMTHYFGRSIAKLRKLRAASGSRDTQRAMSAAYLTSVDRELRLTIDVEPAEFAPLIEWRLDGGPRWLGTEVAAALDAPGVHVLSAGPPQVEERVQIDTYSVSITSHVTGMDIVPEGATVTFTAVTDPPGYEDYITWCSSTMFGQGSPVLGSGATFTAEFSETFGQLPTGGPWQWLGVKADNAAFGQDQKPDLEVNVSAGVQGTPQKIGEINIDIVSGHIEATFKLIPGFNFLQQWYKFRWLNIQIAYLIDSDGDGAVDDPVDADMDGNPDDPLLGELPAVDPQPGDGIEAGMPGDAPGGNPPDEAFNDPKPFYFTDPEKAGGMLPFQDARKSGAQAVIRFRTYLVLENITDPAIGAMTICVLSGFEWTSTIPAGGGQGVEMVVAAIPAPGAAHAAQINAALANATAAEGAAFGGWTAMVGCALTACP